MIKEIELPFDTALAPVTLLQAGALSCMYEQGSLRYIRLGKTEVLRMVYAPVRQQDWGTLPYTIEDEKIDAQPGCFSIQYTAVYRQEKVVYKAFFHIEGHADNRITFSMKGEALAAFKKNRIGICLLHPVKECSGREVMVTRPDGSIYQSVFPELVSPHQPLFDIQQMQWTTAGSIHVKLLFEGDVFEMEDQRNWSDSSYKTYSTPLHIPFPVQVQPGDAMQQKITLAVEDRAGDIVATTAVVVEEKIAFPKIGYCQSAAGDTITIAEILFLQDIPFHHYRVMIDMLVHNWKQVLEAACKDAEQLQVQLELVISFSDQFAAELDALLFLLSEKQEMVYSILVLQNGHAVSPAHVLNEIYPAIKKTLPAVLTGYGTPENFVDVNRNRPVAAIFDFISYALHPQVHMTDSRSILENLDNLPDLIATANSFAPGKPVFVSPVTFSNPQVAMAGADTRQYTALAAWWALMSLQQLAMAGSITYGQLFGEAGLLRLTKNTKGQTVSVQPSYMYEMFAAIQAFEPVWIVKRTAGAHVLMDGLLLENADGDRLFFKPPPAIAGYRK